MAEAEGGPDEDMMRRSSFWPAFLTVTDREELRVFKACRVVSAVVVGVKGVGKTAAIDSFVAVRASSSLSSLASRRGAGCFDLITTTQQCQYVFINL